MTKKEVKETPLMQQYNKIKGKYPDAILLYRVGDFYETFGSDAITVSGVLGITLTKRANGAASEMELAGFPHHALDTYLPKLVRAGFRVAICDQLEDPKQTKTIVKRGVTELVTPGVSLNDNLLDKNANNYLASLYIDKNQAGLALVDISTGEFLLTQGSLSYCDKLIQGFTPSEIIYSRTNQAQIKELFHNQYYTYALDEWIYTHEYAYEQLINHFKTNSLKGFGIEEQNNGITAAGAVLHYLKSTEHRKLEHISKISLLSQENIVHLDRFSIRNLELLYAIQPNGKSLFDVINHSITPMGARLLRKWIVMPLKSVSLIKERQECVDLLMKDEDLASLSAKQLKAMGDLERLVSKISTAKVNAREIVQLKKSLAAIQPIKEAFGDCRNDFFVKMLEQLNPFPHLIEKIENEISEEAPVAISKGNTIKNGVNNELDELREIMKNSKNYLLQIQQEEVQRTSISSLKIGFNNVFGYYLEVTNTHKDKVPAEWVRKQTLTNAERYITEDLKNIEQKILGAEERILTLEEQIFNALLDHIQDYVAPIQLNAEWLARLDCLLSFVTVAKKYDYHPVVIDDSFDIDIKEGRHPVIERQLPADSPYVANDLFLNAENQQIMVITGPNMSGKSALLRQTALICIMAQMGSYVPAKEARIGVVDRIFTRVGASDSISTGESTFMVEMNETASIMNNISERSLILLDEIGRGTSTYDGISLAWSIAEFIHEYPNAKAKTLFATHYHELNQLSEKFNRIKNFNVSTREVGNKVIFLRKLEEGGCEHSFGIHVAQMSGMPAPILNRANEILAQLESQSVDKNIGKKVKRATEQAYQLSIFQTNDPHAEQIKAELNKLDINAMTPVEALWKLNELLKLARN